MTVMRTESGNVRETFQDLDVTLEISVYSLELTS